MKLSMCLLVLVLPALCAAQAVAPPPFEVFDTPDDGGGSITVTWPAAEATPEGTIYVVYIAETAKGPFHKAAAVAPGASLQSVNPAVFGFGPETAHHQFTHINEYEVDDELVAVKNGTPYFIRVGIQTDVGEARGRVVEVAAKEQLFKVISSIVLPET